ncbi:MAG: hypothetical protein KGJ60_09160 [Verrucomicrobiota bacterium]|nr:hypothetical protein [Verrucomicrobiota bacterium]
MFVAGTRVDTLRMSGADTRRFAWALALSLAAHVLGWCVYESGKALQLWHPSRSPRLASLVPPPPQTSQPPLVFVEVNPEQAVAQPPKDARYYSDQNSRAANPRTAPKANQPKLNGRQSDMVKTETVTRPDFNKLQPSPPAPQTRPAPAPSPPQYAMNAGDLTVGKPENSRQEQQEPKPRPRTLRQALAEQPHRLPGLAMRQEGGVPRVALEPSLDVKATPFGAYDRAFIDAVSQRWYDLLDSRRFALDRTGKVTLRFRLNYDGTISDVQVLDNNVGDILGYVCREAITDPAPYPKWPSDMRRMIGADYRDITFTFFYY